LPIQTTIACEYPSTAHFQHTVKHSKAFQVDFSEFGAQL